MLPSTQLLGDVAFDAVAPRSRLLVDAFFAFVSEGWLSRPTTASCRQTPSLHFRKTSETVLSRQNPSFAPTRPVVHTAPIKGHAPHAGVVKEIPYFVS